MELKQEQENRVLDEEIFGKPLKTTLENDIEVVNVQNPNSFTPVEKPLPCDEKLTFLKLLKVEYCTPETNEEVRTEKPKRPRLSPEESYEKKLIRNKEIKRLQRQDPVYKALEQFKNTSRMRERRKDPEYRKKYLEMDKLRKRILRSDPEYRRKEREKNTVSKRERRLELKFMGRFDSVLLEAVDLDDVKAES